MLDPHDISDMGDDAEFEPERPTNEWNCKRCGKKVQRWRGEATVSCDCGAEYNAGGQQLRDDWRGNRSNYDEGVSDLDGFEDQHAGDH